MGSTKTKKSGLPKELLAAYRLLVDPVKWGQRFLRNADGSPRKFWPHQVKDMRSEARQLIHQDGREVGKTVVLSTLVLHYGFTARGGSGLVATPHQGHLETIIDEIEMQIFSNPALEASISKNRLGHLEITHKPYYRIKFTTGTVIHFRPAGDKGQSFRSLHVDRIWVDEAAWMSEPGWKALRRCLNKEGVFRIYSNPNGLRNTTYYRLTKQAKSSTSRASQREAEGSEGKESTEAEAAEGSAKVDTLTGGKGQLGEVRDAKDALEMGKTPSASGAADQWQLVRWPSNLHPNWTPQREQELADFYGGRETAGFQHEVLGQHGAPTYAAFNLEAFRRCQTDLEGYAKISISGAELADCQGEDEIRRRLDMLLGRTPQKGKFWLGGDLGYTSDPCEITIWQEDDEGAITLVLRVHTEQVAYPAIAVAIALLDGYYDFAGLGVDEGGNGLAVVQDLMSLDKFAEHRFSDRLEGYNFASSVVIGYTEAGKQRKKRAKELMTSLIIDRLAAKSIRFPAADLEIEEQLATHTYQMSEGKVIYSKGRDHIVDSARCAVLRIFRETYKEIRPETEEVGIMPLTTEPVFI